MLFALTNTDQTTLALCLPIRRDPNVYDCLMHGLDWKSIGYLEHPSIHAGPVLFNPMGSLYHVS